MEWTQIPEDAPRIGDLERELQEPNADVQGVRQDALDIYHALLQEGVEATCSTMKRLRAIIEM